MISILLSAGFLATAQNTGVKKMSEEKTFHKNPIIKNIHQKYCELPIAAVGATLSATKVIHTVASIASTNLNFFLEKNKILDRY